LIGVWHTAPGINIPDLNMAPSIYFIDREQNTTFQDIGVYNGDSFNVTGAGEPEHVRGLDVTDGTLPCSASQPALGRLFTRQDDTASAPATVMLSYAYWQQKFGGATSVIGSSITMDGKARQIIGVLPRGFHFLDFPMPRSSFPFNGIAARSSSATSARAPCPPQARSHHAASQRRHGPPAPVPCAAFRRPTASAQTSLRKRRIAPKLRPLKQDVVGDVGKVLWVLMGSIAMVLLVACANVANLLLVRVEGRRQELAIRSALGAPGDEPPANCSLKAWLSALPAASSAGPGLRRAARPGRRGAHRPAAHPRDRHRHSGAALHARPGALHQRAHRRAFPSSSMPA
jgi:hypothetical protein